MNETNDKPESPERSAEAPLAPLTCSAVFESENLMAITSPCGHTVPIERAIDGPDAYRCPICEMRYRIQQDPPTVYPSGFIMPGKRHVVIESSKSPGCHTNAGVSVADSMP